MTDINIYLHVIFYFVVKRTLDGDMNAIGTNHREQTG